jgi:hypothetical protein
VGPGSALQGDAHRTTCGTAFAVGLGWDYRRPWLVHSWLLDEIRRGRRTEALSIRELVERHKVHRRAVRATDPLKNQWEADPRYEGEHHSIAHVQVTRLGTGSTRRQRRRSRSAPTRPALCTAWADRGPARPHPVPGARTAWQRVAERLVRTSSSMTISPSIMFGYF